MVIVLLLLYFQFWRKDDPTHHELVLKSLVGLVGYTMLCIAIASYVTNFDAETGLGSGNGRFLSISLLIFTLVCFLMATYFQNARVPLQIGGFMILLGALMAAFGNWLPQVIAVPPPVEEEIVNVRQLTVEERAALGEKVIFGRVGDSETQGAIGKGQCPLCHGFQKDFLSERAPNLFGITERAAERMKDPRYKAGKPNERDTVQKEACPGCGTATNTLEYLAESDVCHSCYVVAGFGMKGSHDTDSAAPASHKSPISLSIDEIIVLTTWLYVHDGKIPPSPDDIEMAYRKFIPESEWPKRRHLPGAGRANTLLAGGEEPLDQLFTQTLCFVCHRISGIDRAVGVVGPKLAGRANYLKRLKDPLYKGKATTVREYIMESIVHPSVYVVTGYPDNVMPKDYGAKLSAAAVDRMVDYLAQLDEGSEPTKAP
jgi:cytochrome c2